MASVHTGIQYPYFISKCLFTKCNVYLKWTSVDHHKRQASPLLPEGMLINVIQHRRQKKGYKLHTFHQFSSFEPTFNQVSVLLCRAFGVVHHVQWIIYWHKSASCSTNMLTHLSPDDGEKRNTHPLMHSQDMRQTTTTTYNNSELRAIKKQWFLQYFKKIIWKKWVSNMLGFYSIDQKIDAWVID